MNLLHKCHHTNIVTIVSITFNSSIATLTSPARSWSSAPLLSKNDLPLKHSTILVASSLLTLFVRWHSSSGFFVPMPYQARTVRYHKDNSASQYRAIQIRNRPATKKPQLDTKTVFSSNNKKDLL
jgi:hypothetical protein